MVTGTQIPVCGISLQVTDIYQATQESPEQDYHVLIVMCSMWIQIKHLLQKLGFSLEVRICNVATYEACYELH